MPKLTIALDDWLDRRPRIALGFSLLLLLLVGTFHHLSSKDYNFDFVYLMPVAIAARYCGLRCGLSVSVLSAGTWFAADYWSFYTEQTWLTDWSLSPLQLSAVNAGLCLLVFASIALLVSSLESDVVYAQSVSQTKSDMLSVVSHEFANALNTMGMAVFLLEEEMGEAPSPKQLEMYDVLHRNLTSLKTEVENLLNEARMESGRFALDPKPIDAGKAVRSAAAALEASARQKKLEVRLELADTPVTVRADPDALHLILTNLIGNAVKYTPAPGRVTVSVSISGEPPLIAAFCVADTGIGMSEKEQRDALKGFTRTSRGKKLASGFGLGLKTARDMLASHGARLEISSRPGKGSRFSFSLPVVQDQSPTRA